MDESRFLAARDRIINGQPGKNGIGCLGEKTLHALLKSYLQPDESKQEVRVGGYIADIADGEKITEIQTRQFYRLRKKLDAFLPLYPVTVVFPVAGTKWLYWIDESTGEVTQKRKSPKTGTSYEIFRELYQIKPFLLNESLRFLIVVLEMEEYRLLDGWSGDRKKGSSRYDRIPLQVQYEVALGGAAGYAGLLPTGLPDTFTVKDFKAESRLSLKAAGAALNVLSHVGAAERTGKRGRMFLYRRTDT